MFSRLNYKRSLFNLRLHFKKKLNAALHKEMKNLKDDKYTITCVVKKDENYLKLLSPIEITVDGKVEKMPFLPAMYMLNALSDDYLSFVKKDLLSQVFKGRCAEIKRGDSSINLSEDGVTVESKKITVNDATHKDNVNHPSHYNQNDIETIDIIERFLDDDSCFAGFLYGNMVKYLDRYENKNGIEDLKKAQWYLNKLIADDYEKTTDLVPFAEALHLGEYEKAGELWKSYRKQLEDDIK